MSSCGGTYSFAENFEQIFSIPTIQKNAETSYHSSLKVYPNPANHFIYLNNLQLQEKTMIGIYNTLGEAVLTAISSDQIPSLDVSKLSDGLYLIKANDQVGRFMKL
jgi:hypothetical protein